MRVGRRQDLDLFACLAATLLAVAGMLLFPEATSPLRAGLGLLLVLLVPGYCAMAALFPGKGDLDGVERLAVSIGLSIAATPLVALVLDQTPWGIGLDSLVWGLSSFIFLAAAVAFLRRRSLPREDRFTLPMDKDLSRGLAFGVLVIGAVLLAMGLVQPKARFTAFYVLGDDGRTQGYPSELAPEESFQLTVVVENREGRTMNYAIHLPNRAAPVRVPSLADGETWSADLTITAPRTLGPARLPLELYRSGDESPYRLVYLIVDIVPTGARLPGSGLAAGPPPSDGILSDAR